MINPSLSIVLFFILAVWLANADCFSDCTQVKGCSNGSDSSECDKLYGLWAHDIGRGHYGRTERERARCLMGGCMWRMMESKGFCGSQNILKWLADVCQHLC